MDDGNIGSPNLMKQVENSITQRHNTDTSAGIQYKFDMTIVQALNWR